MKYSGTEKQDYHGKNYFDGDHKTFQKKQNFDQHQSPQFKASPYVDSTQTYNLDSRGVSSRYSTSNYVPSRTDSIEKKYLNRGQEYPQHLNHNRNQNGQLKSPYSKYEGQNGYDSDRKSESPRFRYSSSPLHQQEKIIRDQAQKLDSQSLYKKSVQQNSSRGEGHESPKDGNRIFERKYVTPGSQNSQETKEVGKSGFHRFYETNYSEPRSSPQNSSRQAQRQVSMLKHNEPIRDNYTRTSKPSSKEQSPSQVSDLDIEYYDQSTTANLSPSKRSHDADKKTKVIERLYVSVKY